MEKTEIESKLADLKAKKGNKSLPESAIKSLDKMIADLENKLLEIDLSTHTGGSKTAGEEKKKLKKAGFKQRGDKFVKPSKKADQAADVADDDADARNEKLAEMLGNGDSPEATAMWDSFTPAQQKSFMDYQYEAFTDFSEAGNWENGKKPTRKAVEKDQMYLIELGREKLGKEKKVKKVKAESKKKETKKVEPSVNPKTGQYNCDELIEEAKAKTAKAKERAAKKDAEPKKTEVTKAKERIEKTHASIEKKVEAGEFKKPQLQKLISETEDLLNMLKKALKNL